MSTHHFTAWWAVPVEVERRAPISDDYDPDEFNVNVRVMSPDSITLVILEHVGRREIHRMARRFAAAAIQYPLTPDELAQLVEQEEDS